MINLICNSDINHESLDQHQSFHFLLRRLHLYLVRDAVLYMHVLMSPAPDRFHRASVNFDSSRVVANLRHDLMEYPARCDDPKNLI